MSRELKFRAWDHQTKKLSYFNLRNTSGYLPSDIPDDQIQQFTGCFDKNIKEIYEGDIVRVTSTGYINDNYTATVIYGEAEFCFKVNDNDIRGCWSGNDVEVIGNIFEKKSWEEMYEMQTKLVLSLELNKIEKEKEIDSLKEALKLQKHVYDVGAEDLELDKKELYKRIEFLEETQKQLANCIEKCWNCFGDSKFKVWDFVNGLGLLIERVQDVVEDERMHQKIVDKTYDILAGNPPVDLPKGIFSIPELVENMFEELKDLVIENKRLEDKVERYREENKTLQSYLDNINKNLKQMTGEK